VVELLNVGELQRAATKHPQVATWLNSWRAGAEAASWQNITEVRRTYPTADGVTLGKGKNRVVITVFNAGGNDYRLLTRISYLRQLLQIEQLLTHAEYSKNKWKRRYE
jgi:mRNA interferase HigB